MSNGSVLLTIMSLMVASCVCRCVDIKITASYVFVSFIIDGFPSIIIQTN